MKKEKIKIILLTICLLILTFEIHSTKVEINDLFIKDNTRQHINIDDLNFNFQTQQNKEIEITSENFYLIIQKVQELIFLVAGFIMTLIFITNQNKDFSLIETINNKIENE